GTKFQCRPKQCGIAPCPSGKETEIRCLAVPDKACLAPERLTAGGILVGGDRGDVSRAAGKARLERVEGNPGVELLAKELGRPVVDTVEDVQSHAAHGAGIVAENAAPCGKDTVAEKQDILSGQPERSIETDGLENRAADD